ncbi:MAG: hypothetical protein AAF388_02030 [Bacteroidota bacterium]
MNSGYFFLMDEKNASSGKSIFHYKPIREKIGVVTHYPIYLVLGQDQLSFHYMDYSTPETSKILYLDLFPLEKVDSLLSSQLNQIANVPLHELFRKFEKDDKSNYKFLLDKVEGFSSSFCIQGHTLGHNMDGKICLATLVLDFLYDYKQSDIFEYSDKYNRLKGAIEGNFLFSSILAKAEFLFYKDENQSIEIAISHQAKLVYHYLLNAQKKWLSYIIDERSPGTLAPTGWFKDNLEEEAEEIISCISYLKNEKNIEETQSGKEIKFAPILNRLSEWYVSRFSIKKAFEIKKKFQNFDLEIILFPLTLLIILGTFLIAIPSIFVNASALNDSPGIAILFGLSFLMIAFLWGKKLCTILLSVEWLDLVGIYLPKLSLTILISWLGYLTSVKRLLQLQFSWNILLFYGTITTLLILLYLLKEISEEAPDLPFKQSRKRALGIISIALILSGFFGIVILLVASQNTHLSNFENANKIFCFPRSVSIWASGTITTFFISLFVNLLFRGKKFTGF